MFEKKKTLLINVFCALQRTEDVQREKSITHAKFYCEFCCKQYVSISEWDVSCCDAQYTLNKQLILLFVSGAYSKLRT